MAWEEYRRRYVTFDLALQQTRIVAAASASVLSDFPNKLPKELQEAFKLARERFLNQLLPEGGDTPGNRMLEAREPLDRAARAAESYVELGSILATSYIEAGLDNMELDAEPHDIDFELAASVQQLVMSLAHLDAFLADTLFAICQSRPAPEQAENSLDGATELETGDWDELARRLPVTFVEDFRGGAAAKRITSIGKYFGLHLNLPPHVLNVLRFAQNVRNLYVHSAGCVSQEFIRRTRHLPPHIGAFDLAAFIDSYERDNECQPDEETAAGVDQADWALGEMVPWDLQVADALTRIIQNTAGELYCAVSVQIFGKPRNELGNVHFW